MTTISSNNAPMQPASDIDAALALLDGHPDYRVLRRLPPAETLITTLPPVLPLRVAAVVDVETTGLFPELDEVIELAVQRVRFDALGRIVQVGQPRSWLQQPTEPLTAEITAITGLTDADLAGQQFDIATATELIGGADVIIAHNAAFDRPFVDLLLPEVRGAAWACSMCEVDWGGSGSRGARSTTSSIRLGGAATSSMGTVPRPMCLPCSTCSAMTSVKLAGPSWVG